MRKQYDLTKLKGGVRGKYLSHTTTASNLVLLDPEVAGMFPNSEAVNRALSLLADTAISATSSDRADRRLLSK
jgi:hypothetical protein